MKRLIQFLCVIGVLELSSFVLAQTPPTIPGEWRRYEVTYKLPKPEGLTASMQIVYFVTPDRKVLDAVVWHQGKNLRMNQNGLVVFETTWALADKNLEYIIATHFENGRFVITAHLLENEQDLQVVTRGALPLTNEELQIANVISGSKGPEAQIKNEELGVSDVDLAQWIIFAARSYDVPLNFLVALICQETKFNAGSTDRAQIKGIAQLSLAAISDVETTYFKLPDVAEKIKRYPFIKPNKELWTLYTHNLLYAAAYLDYLSRGIKALMPQTPQMEVWKFVCIWYNYGMGAAKNTWEKAGRPTAWNRAFALLLPEGEKRTYSGSIFFYIHKIEQGETNLFQYQPSIHNAQQRLNFVRQFNGL